ncbi:sensor histidine kinase [Caballeronia humi]|uniref:histidine kinase n=1 Tax=Caballeronia humi TaxID=326474 RepID=A0A158EW26_9BURK|nr:ATP-binding protein [Caballeronia humi]SAL11761.1 ATPase [Caballeronia humi]
MFNALAAGIPVLLSASSFADTSAAVRWRVLIMQGGDPYLPSAIAQDRGIREVFARESDATIEFVTEPLHALESGTPPPDTVITQYLKTKFAQREPDVVIALRQPALGFLERNANALWPDVPIVFCGIPDDDLLGRVHSAHASGVRMAFDVAGTLDLARRLQPNADRIAVIAGTSTYDQAWRRRIESTVAMRTHGLPVTWISDAPLDIMLERVAQLPARTIILYSSVFRDANGNTFIPRDLIRLFADKAHAPIFSFFSTYLGAGIVGGSISSWEEQGAMAGALALRILRNAGRTTPSIMPSPPSVTTVDWRQLQRWNIDSSLLPPGTKVLYKPDSLFRRYRTELGIGALVLVAQTGLIASLLIQRRRANRAEHAAAEQRSALDQASRLAVLGELTAGIAHEINQPLGAIMTSADAAQMMLEKSPPMSADAAMVVASIQRASARASEVVQKVRSLARGKPLELRPLHLNDVVREANDLMIHSFSDASVACELALASDLPRIVGDKSALQQVLLNLILNAIDAMKDVPVTKRRLTLSTSVAGPDEVALAASDSGHGLSEQAQKHLFDSFFTTKPTGLGLGLTIVRSIVEAHGGRLAALNNEGVGATIRITLRVAERTGLSREGVLET